MKSSLMILLLISAGFAIHAAAQPVTQSTMDFCRKSARTWTDFYKDVQRKEISPGVFATQPSDDWVSQVHHYMAQALESSPRLSADELRSLGYAYCVERRPAGR